MRTTNRPPSRASAMVACAALALAAGACDGSAPRTAAGPGDTVGVAGNVAAAADTVRVAVAANFAVASDTLAARFTASTGITIVSTIGSTGLLFAQVHNGAPFDVFLAADTVRPAMLEADGAAVPGSRFTYAMGALALYAPRRPAVIDTPAGLTAPSVRHLAIADPALAPYGAAAMQVMSRWRVADALAPRLVRGESLAQTFQFVSSGAADAGFVALAQVIRMAGARYFVVPDSLHDAIRQDAVLLARARAHAGARRYLDFLRSAEGRSVIASFGYGVPPTDTTVHGRR